MPYQKSIRTAQEELIEQIENTLKADLGFLYKLAPRELGILATSLKDLGEQKKKYLLIDYSRKSIDF
jgi:hypothetical protein